MIIIEKIKRNKLLVLVFLIYGGMFIFASDKAIKSVSNSVYYLLEMLQVLPIIFLLTVLIDAWIPKELITKRLGDKSGFLGNLFSLLLGSLSAGPIYAAFPLGKMLFKKGASVTNIVIILSSWAVIKVPMLINEVKFLSFNFMVIRWLLTVTAIFIMSYLISLFVKKKDLASNDVRDNSSTLLEINEQYCIGCGICAKISPKYFKMRNNKAQINNVNIKQNDIELIKSSMNKCPANAIILSMNNKENNSLKIES